jgi:iron complex outermembrane receptor protein
LRILLCSALLAGLWSPFLLAQQDCALTLRGYLIGEHDGEPLAYASIYSETALRGTQADSLGYFQLDGLCDGAQVVRFSHIGCDPRQLVVDLRGDSLVTVRLHHHDNFVETVTVAASVLASYDQALDGRATQQLGEVMERIAGVSTLRTGSAATKPVYDGAFGNRLSIQNNGIAQSGQQWGNDHAPEIDSWVAAYVRVIEGVEALRYAGPTVAATVLVEPAALQPETVGGGKVAYGLQSNGWGHTLNARLTGTTGRNAYRLSATGKRSGDLRAPGYYLRNTGRQEANAALQFARFHGERWTSRLYYSLFTANIGVLRGSHIGNLSDLRRAIGRETPFFTEPDFSYGIAAPRQQVAHHLLKLETEFRPNVSNRYWVKYGGQLNDRREFDVRRAGDGDTRPALDLLQWDHQGEFGYHRNLGRDRHLDALLQGGFTDTENQAGTGVLPLLPDHEAIRLSAYTAYHHEGDGWQYHAGLRADYRGYDVRAISRDLPRRVARFDHTFLTVGASIEGRYRLSDRLSLSGGLTYRQRAPEVNELHAFGLHQGVSGIEEGDTSLLPERSLKLRLGTLYATDRHSLSLDGFVQPVSDYIFLQPQSEFRLTIRGAFPVFLYRAGDALLYGLRAHWRYRPDPALELNLRLAVVRGRNRSEGRPLIYVPADNLRADLAYHPGRPEQGWTLRAESYTSARQRRLDPEQDFLAPPPGYTLIDLAVEKLIVFGPSSGRKSLHLRAAARNLFDVVYRDYLDRQRYFADAPGRSLDFRITYSW